MAVRLFKRGNVYWFELVYDGKRYQRSTRIANRRVAGDVADTFKAALVRGDAGIIDRKPMPRFQDAMKAFLAWSTGEHHAHPRTALRYQISSKPLLRFFKNEALDKITPEVVERYKTERGAEKGKRTGRKLRPATVNRELACLRAMFNHALKADLPLRNPVSRVKFLAEDNMQDRVLRYAEEAAYLSRATPLLRDVAGLILETGMRPEEVYTLRDSAVDLEHGFLRVLRGKTPAAKRRIELTEAAVEILSRRIEAVGAGYLFPHDKDATRSVPKVNNAHDRAVRDSGVARFRLYDLRHTWATRAAEAGTDLVTLAAMMGHSRIQMVMRYAHPTQDHQSGATHRIAQHKIAAAAREKAAVRLAEERKAGKSSLVVMRREA